MILLDTDHLTVLKYTDSERSAAPWPIARRGPGTDRHHYRQR